MEKAGNEIKAVIFDWAGTTVDYGCFAPANVFIEVFRKKGIAVTIEQARKPMGMNKRDHISEIMNMKEIDEQWQTVFGRVHDESDIDSIYADFIPLQLEEIKSNCRLIPGVVELKDELKKRNILIGSSSGYNNEMMSIVIAESAKQGFEVDNMVCSSDVNFGRPAPWMAIKNAMLFNVYPFTKIVKVGDTIADIKEGTNAGMWSVGVIDSSNEMGLTFENFNLLSEDEKEEKRKTIKTKFYDAGAHFVINEIGDLPFIIDEINKQLNDSNN